jgi:amidase
MEVFKTKALTTPELFKLNAKHLSFKVAASDAWTTAEMDVLMCPCAPAAGIPHSFPVWWGYTTIFNLLDLPSTIIPLTGFKIDAVKDPKETEYVPRANGFDGENWRVCKSSLTVFHRLFFWCMR